MSVELELNSGLPDFKDSIQLQPGYTTAVLHSLNKKWDCGLYFQPSQNQI